MTPFILSIIIPSPFGIMFLVCQPKDISGLPYCECFSVMSFFYKQAVFFWCSDISGGGGGAGEYFVRKVTSFVSNHSQVFRAVGEPLINLPHCDMKSLRSA